MGRDEASPPEGNTFVRFFDRVDRAMMHVLGPPPISDGRDENPTPVNERACPVCGHPMFEHVVDHSSPNTVLVCPTDVRLPEHEPTSGPLNELGMPATGRRLERFEHRTMSG